MNNTLKTELKEYFKVINERKKLLDNELEKCKLSTEERIDEMEARANVKLHKLAKKYMDKENFDFEKGRNSSQDRIRFNDGFLELRSYRHHNFYTVDFTSSCGNAGEITEFLPAGFRPAIDKVNELIEKVNALSTDFEKELKTKIKVVITDDNKIKRGIVKEIKLNDEFKVNTNDYLYIGSYEQEQLYYNDKIFNNCLSLIDMKKVRHKWLSGRLNGYDRRLDRLLDNGCENIIIATRLTE